MPPRATPATVDDYIQACPPKVRAVLRKVRTTARRVAPHAEERISYRMPALFQDGVVIYYAAFTKHIGIFPPVRGDAALLRELAPYRGPKGNLQFPLDQPMPYELIRRVVQARVREKEQRTTPGRTTKPRSAARARRGVNPPVT